MSASKRAARERRNEIVRLVMACDRGELRYLLVEVVRELLARGDDYAAVKHLVRRSHYEPEVAPLDLAEGS